MRLFSKMKFRTKLGLGITVIVMLMALMSALPVSRMAADAVLEESKRRGQVLAENLSLRAAEPILTMDLLVLKNLVDEVVKVGDDLVYAFILDVEDQVLTHTFKGGFPVELRDANSVDSSSRTHIRLLQTGKELVYDIAAPVLIAGDRFGTVRLGLSRTKAQAVVNDLLLAIAGLSAAGLVVAVFMSTLFARRITHRLQLLRAHAEEVVKGGLDPTAGPQLTHNCWEIMDCDLTQCPAHGDSRRRCWYQAGPMSVGGDAVLRDKAESCQNCPVYRENRGDELQDLAETLDVMSMTLKTRLEELQQAEHDLTRQGRLLRTILDVTPDLVSLLDEKLVYLMANKAFIDFFGKNPEEVIGSTDVDVFSSQNFGESTQQEHEENLQVIREKRPLHREVCMSKDGVEHWFHVVKLPVLDSKGRVMGLLRSARDITAVKQFQEQLTRSQKMESLGRMAGGVAHEINTPLGIILGYAQLLMEDFDPNSQAFKDIKTIEKQTKVCRRIVSDMLGFSRQTESSKQTMSINDSLTDVVSLVSHTFALDKVIILVDLDPAEPAVNGDAEKLKQVWMNLLSNARDAMKDKGGGIIFVRTQVDAGLGLVRIWVADTGPGIGSEDLKRIFDPFFTTKPVGKGTGLGLSVSYGIVEDHGGVILPSSPPPEELYAGSFADVDGLLEGRPRGRGACFTVELPLAEGDEA